MKCSYCDFENPPDSFFCSKCGGRLTHPKEDFASTETYYVPVLDLEIGSTFAGRYQIIEELGRGGMGRVYKALDKEINEKIAIKILKPEVSSDKNTIERFRNELKFARKIRHGNVCQMYDLMKEKDSYFITMEYVSGEDLKSTMLRVGQLSVGKTLIIAKQICKGLVEAHKLGVIHRDLKPHNIMIDRAGDVRIMDFGIARSLRSAGLTESGMMIGTPEYMSPEQALGEEVDQRSDIYSLGIILYELVTGKVPFKGDTPVSVALKQKTELPPDPRIFNEQISDDLTRLILKCLEKDKKKRFQNIEEVLYEIINIEKGQPTTDKVIPEKEVSLEIPRKRISNIVLPTALAVIAILIVVLIFWPKGEKVLLSINTDPSDARVFFEGKLLGRSPVKENVAPGSYDIRIEKDGYKTEERSITFESDFEKTYTLDKAELVLPQTGNLEITSKPEGAGVYINGEQKGNTPLMSEIPSGTYKISINHPQFQEKTEDVQIEAGSTFRKEYVLDPFYTIRIPANPAGAIVRIDRIIKGPTPITINEWTKRTIRLTIEKQGWTSYNRTVTLRPGINNIDYSLKALKTEAARTKAAKTEPEKKEVAKREPEKKEAVKTEPEKEAYKLSIETNPPGAQVFLNGELRGLSPLEKNVPPGTYTVKIKKAGYKEEKASVTINSDKTKVYELTRLEKVKIKIKVAKSANVVLDGEEIGEVPPVKNREVEEGICTIEFSSERLDIRYRVGLRVKAGESWELRMNMQTGLLIQINTKTGDSKSQTLVPIK